MAYENRQIDSFGTGHFVGEVMREPDFFDMPLRDQALELGWINGCPVAQKLTDPNPMNVQNGRGPEAMLHRYAEVNFWFTYISDQIAGAEEGKGTLHSELTGGTSRDFRDQIGGYEKDSVPYNYREQMSPLGTLPGYSMPRLLLDQFGPADEHGTYDEGRLSRGLKCLDEAIAEARYPEELLAVFGQKIMDAKDITPERVLKHVLSSSWLEEHGAVEMLEDTKVTVRNNAPKLHWLYVSITDARKRKKLGIA